MAEESTAVYVYGIVPADVEVDDDAEGIGGNPVEVVRQGDIAALISPIEVREAIGRPEDLSAHEGLLDAAATEVPVLPLRFGAVLTSRDAVAEELLEDNHDEFAAALREMEGRREYVVKGRFVEKAILRKIIEGNRDAAQLRDQIKGGDEVTTRDARMRLGEIVQQQVEAWRDKQTQSLVDDLKDRAVSVAPLPPTHDYDAVNVAFLVESEKADDFTGAVEKIAEEHSGLIEFRLLGPLAAYDFVVKG